MFVNAQSTFGEYRVNTDDFFGTLTIEWSAGPNATVVDPGQPGTNINFARGNAQPGRFVPAHGHRAGHRSGRQQRDRLAHRHNHGKRT